MICSGFPSGSRNEAKRAYPATSPSWSNATPRADRGDGMAVHGPVQREPPAADVELRPPRSVLADEREPQNVAVERHPPVHVGYPVVDVVEGDDDRRSSWRRF